MKILDQINIEEKRNEFLQEASDHSKFYLERAFSEFNIWHRVIVKYDDIKNLSIGASPTKNYPTKLFEAAKELIDNPDLIGNKQEGLNLEQVKICLDGFEKNGVELGNVFILRDYLTGKDMYIIDGMHRLVAHSYMVLKGDTEFEEFTAYFGEKTQ